MFTGIVAGTGTFGGFVSGGPGRAITVAAPVFSEEAYVSGESIAVNGVCLTVDAFEGPRFTAAVSPETLSRTNLGALRPGAPVNLERAVRPVDRLGGHFVLGHVDAVGALKSRRPEGPFETLAFSAPPDLRRYLVEKGSIAVDGVSLTIAALTPDGFTVAAIPHTLARTTLPGLRPGDGVNLETDILAKYVEKLLGGKPAGGLTMDALAAGGFLR